MRIWLTRLIWLLVLAIVATVLWDQRGRIAQLSNNNFRIEGDWHRVEVGFKGDDVYNFSDRIITKNGTEWGSYELRTNTRLEVLVSDQPGVYELSFPDDDTMVWSVEVDGRSVPSQRWQR
jgi:hypothetical protein